MPVLQIRPLEPADVPALLHIIAETRREYGLLSADAASAEEGLYARFQRQRSLYFVALQDGEVVGGAGIAPLSAADPLTCELQHMYLSPRARGQGVGDALLERCLAAAKQFLYVRCYLEAEAQMQPAIEFYGRHGFRDLREPLARGSARTEREELPQDRWMLRTLRASARATLGL